MDVDMAVISPLSCHSGGPYFRFPLRPEFKSSPHFLLPVPNSINISKTGLVAKLLYFLKVYEGAGESIIDFIWVLF